MAAPNNNRLALLKFPQVNADNQAFSRSIAETFMARATSDKRSELSEFTIVSKGFDPDQVRATLSTFAESMREMLAENEQLRQQVSSSRGSQADLFSALQQAEEIRSQARRDAQAFVDQANAHAARLEDELRAHVAAAQAELDAIEAKVLVLRAQETITRQTLDGLSV
jgi:hypothetical protein